MVGMDAKSPTPHTNEQLNTIFADFLGATRFQKSNELSSRRTMRPQAPAQSKSVAR